MLEEESEIIKELLLDVEHRVVLNMCSSDENFYKKMQPHIWDNVILPLAERVNKVINLDMKEGDGVDVVNDCRDMKDVSDQSIDIVLFFSGVEHILEPKRAINEIYRVLKPDGLLAASAPGVYPKHDDPIDTMLRLPRLDDWQELLGPRWKIMEFSKTTPCPAKAFYKFNELVFATIVIAQKDRYAE